MKDAVAFEVDSSGNLLWAKSMGGSNNDEAFSVTQASDGGSIVCGYSLSSDGDIGIPNTGNEQNWIIRLSDIPVGILDNQECKNAVSGEIKNQSRQKQNRITLFFSIRCLHFKSCNQRPYF